MKPLNSYVHEVLVKKNLKPEKDKKYEILDEYPKLKLLIDNINICENVTEEYLSKSTYIIYNQETAEKFLENQLTYTSEQRDEYRYVDFWLTPTNNCYSTENAHFDNLDFTKDKKNMKFTWEDEHYVWLEDLTDDFKNGIKDLIIFEFKK